MDSQEWSNKWLVFIVVWVQFTTQLGLCFSLGALFLDFQLAFGASRLQTALVQSIMIGVVLSLSVFSGFCIRRYGLFKVLLCPALLSPLGLMTSYAASEIWNIYITIGVIAGIGMTCTQTASFTVVRQAFRGRQMMLCLSILSTGAGIGGTFYPFLLTFLVQRLGLQMTLLSIGVFFMTSSLLPLLIRCHDIKYAETRESDDPEKGPYTVTKNTSGTESEPENGPYSITINTSGIESEPENGPYFNTKNTSGIESEPENGPYIITKNKSGLESEPENGPNNITKITSGLESEPENGPFTIPKITSGLESEPENGPYIISKNTSGIESEPENGPYTITKNTNGVEPEPENGPYTFTKNTSGIESEPENGQYTITKNTSGVETKPENGPYPITKNTTGVESEPENGPYTITKNTSGIESEPENGPYIITKNTSGVESEPENGPYTVTKNTSGVESEPENGPYTISKNTSGVISESENGPNTITKNTSGVKPKGKDNIIKASTQIAIWADIKSIISLEYIIIVLGSDFIVASINGSIMALQLDLMKSKNVDVSWSNMVFIVRSVSVIVSSLLPGLGKQFGISVNVILSMAAVIGAAGYLLVQLSSGHVSFLVANGLVGTTLGASLPASMIAMKMVPIEHMPVASGLMTSGVGVLSAASGPLFAFIRESTGSYDIVLYLIAAIHCAAALAFLGCLLVKNRKIDNRSDFVTTRL
ncbi:hypothetical protein DPMN_025374 [Dreissena polymorpha]|uniref:Uncharacterized protein n=1 Tax=Dreissena polymorpha TaxID=45954 RepID=A0A9D4LRE4_DREPO|nr:hypothetical protein DPMN_025374 [Dreissena polymorpha]